MNSLTKEWVSHVLNVLNNIFSGAGPGMTGTWVVFDGSHGTVAILSPCNVFPFMAKQKDLAKKNAQSFCVFSPLRYYV